MRIKKIVESNKWRVSIASLFLGRGFSPGLLCEDLGINQSYSFTVYRAVSFL